MKTFEKYVEIADWFRLNKWYELYERYHCSKLYSVGKVIGETEKAYKIEVGAFFIKSEKNVTIWAPKSVCTNIDTANC